MNESPARFYIVVRSDLPPGPQLAQSTHAAIQFSQEWPDLIGPWFRESNYLVVVTVENEEALWAIADQARELGVRYSAVEEPDMKNTWTALALAPGETARLICSCMPLALKEAVEPKAVGYP